MTNAPRLPPDVIREILSHAAPSGAPTGTDSAYEREPYGVPWELALVDQSWRQCAIESRSLRTCLTLDGADFTDPEALARLECQLERSSSKTLDVSLSGSQPFEILRASPAFLASCSRWETLLVRPEPDASFDDLGLADGKFTMLRRLEFVCAGEELESTLDEFSNAGSLREVILTDKDFEFPSPEVDLPWQQITHLRAFYDSHQAFLVVAEETVNLVDLALHIDPNAPAVIASTVALPKLRHLYAHVSECLSSFIAPALCELTCSAARPFGVHSFCARGNILSSLCSLTLLGFTGSPDEIWGILLDFTALKHLAIESVAPSLETFVYCCLEVEEDDLEVFFRMVRSRSRAEPPAGDNDPWRCLRYVRIFWVIGPHPPASAYEDDVRDIKAEGIDLEVIPGASQDKFEENATLIAPPAI
ncbi:hypothetical protein DFH07DRAFT_1058816 [Mycena maculata]|uniref:F-box domain-containing protein n=1 Tax=Mycena maculata TaxID=230809 RepID=A0AAD7JJQ6_9AGAR|nr:hypothetical protein DFH07DRAFT_1058816 [Mycena maculata]